MIGRLVKDQQLRRFRAAQHASEAGAQQLAAAQRRDGLKSGIGAEHEAGKCRPARIFAGAGIEPAIVVPDIERWIEDRDRLVEHGEIDHAVDFARPWSELAGDQPEQGCLA